MNKQLKYGVVIGYVSILIGNIIPLIYTPIMLNILGQNSFGLYNIAISFTAYLSLLNVGLGGAITKFVSDKIAEGDDEGKNNVIQLFLKIFTYIALIALLVGGIFIISANLVFSRKLSPEDIHSLQILFMIISSGTAISFPASVFSSIIISHEKYVFNKLIGLLSTIVAPILKLILLFNGAGIYGLVLANLVIIIVVLLFDYTYCIKILKIKIVFKPIDKKLLKVIFNFSKFIFLAQIVEMLYWATDNVILGIFRGSVAVAVYSIGATFIKYVISFSTAISSVLFPKVNIMVRNECSNEELSDLFTKVGRLQFVVIGLIVGGFIVLGKQFVLLWAGEKYIDSFIIALLVMIPVTIPLIQNTGLSILQAKSKHAFRSYVFLVVAILNIALSLALVEKFGAIGCAVATCIAYFIGPVFIMNWYYKVKIGLDIQRFWKSILGMSFPIVIVSMLMSFGTRYWEIDTWIEMFLAITIFTTSYMLLSWFISLNEYEKAIFISPYRKIENKLKRSA